MATAEQRRELTLKLTRYVAQTYGGSGLDAWRRAFQQSDDNGDGYIREDELARLLERAGVGNFFTRGMWADGVLRELDKDRSQSISFEELAAVLDARVNPTPPASQPTGPAPIPVPPRNVMPRGEPPQGTTVAERLNNAIVRLDYVVAGAGSALSLYTQQSVAKLVDEWLRFWAGGARALLPEAMHADTYVGFLHRYAKCWVMLPPPQRSKVPDPRKLAFDAGDVVHDSVRAYVDALRQEAKWVSDAVDSAQRSVVGLAVLAIGGLLAWGYARRR